MQITYELLYDAGHPTYCADGFFPQQIACLSNVNHVKQKVRLILCGTIYYVSTSVQHNNCYIANNLATCTIITVLMLLQYFGL